MRIKFNYRGQTGYCDVSTLVAVNGQIHGIFCIDDEDIRFTIDIDEILEEKFKDVVEEYNERLSDVINDIVN